MRAGDLIATAQDTLGDPAGSVHTPAKMLSSLNFALNSVSGRCRTVTTEYYLPVQEGLWDYALPRGILEIKGVRYHQTSQSPPLKRRSHKYVETLANANSGIPRYFAEGQRAAIERGIGTVASVPSALTINLTAELPARVGDTLINLTAALPQSTVQTVTNNDGSTQLVLSAPVGGSGRGFQTGDQVRIISPDLGGLSIVVAPRPNKTDAAGDESLSVFAVIRHREITQANIDHANDELSIDPELEDMVRYQTLFEALNLSGEIQMAAYWQSQAEKVFDDNIAKLTSPRRPDVEHLGAGRWVRWHDRDRCSTDRRLVQRLHGCLTKNHRRDAEAARRTQRKTVIKEKEKRLFSANLCVSVTLR